MTDGNSSKGGSIRVGLALILLGSFFLLWQIIPGFSSIFSDVHGPALILFGVALLLAVIGLATGAAGMAIPVCILAGLGGIFYWQQASGTGFLSWSYAWTLIPGFVGVGMILRSILSGWPWRGIEEGVWTIVVSVALFFVFGAAFGELNILGPYWPVILILLGLYAIVRPLLRRS